MILTDHDVRQIDRDYMESLDKGTLLKLAVNLLEDLKEARERLNQNPPQQFTSAEQHRAVGCSTD